MAHSIRTKKKASKSKANGLPNVLSGALAGALATGPMTLALFEIHRALPNSERSPLPPATISHELLNRASSAPNSESIQAITTVTAHFGYGTGAGMLYSVLFGAIKLNPVVRGGIFGAGFWAANYLGVAPAINLRAAAPNMPARRNGMMFGTHLLWGAFLGYAHEVLLKDGKNLLAGDRKAPDAE